MSFGGFVSHMITSLKNNERNRVSNFDKIKGFKKNKKSELYLKNKTTPKQLIEIRKKIERENNINFIKKNVILIVLIMLLIYAIGFVEK